MPEQIAEASERIVQTWSLRENTQALIGALDRVYQDDGRE